jgi:hypothetical protein
MPVSILTPGGLGSLRNPSAAALIRWATARSSLPIERMALGRTPACTAGPSRVEAQFRPDLLSRNRLRPCLDRPKRRLLHVVADRIQWQTALDQARHTGNHFAASSGAGLKDLMARVGHDSERAAIIYQHEARGADAVITNAIDAHVEAERGRDDEGDNGPAGVLVPAG